MEIIGLLGAFLLVVAWLPPTLSTLINKKSTMNMWFQILFFIGAGLLVVYSIQINNFVFVILNAVAAFFAFINLQYIPNKIEKIEHEIDEILGRKDKKYYHVKKKVKK